MATILEQLKVILGIETKGFPSVRSQIRGLTEGVQKDISGLKAGVAGFFTVAAGTELVRSVVSMAQRWKDIAEETGESSETIQKYDAYAKRASGTVEDLAAAWDILIEKRKDALENGGESARMFKAFGIDETELRRLDRGRDIFERIAAVANDPKNTSQREQFIETFGRKRAGKLLNIASSVSEGGDVSVVSNQANQELDDAAKAFERGALEFKVAAAPLVTAMAEWVQTAWKFFTEELPDKSGDRNRSKDFMSQLIDISNGKTSMFSGEFKYGEKQRNAAGELWRKYESAIRSGTLTDAQATELQEGIASIKSGKPRTAKKSAPHVNVVEINGDAPATNPATGLPMPLPGQPGYSADIKRDKKRYQDALDATLFKASNSDEKKRMLREQLQRDAKEASDLRAAGKADDASKIEADIIKKAGELGELGRTKPYDWKSDSLAAVGGFIGGAAGGIDPSVQVQQDMKAQLASIVRGIEGLPQHMKDAFEAAMKTKPIDRLGGGR